MTHAIVLRETGAPEMLRYEPVVVAAPGAGQIRIRQTAIGVNYHDVNVRRGQNRIALPGTPGIEGAGVVEAVGPDVAGFSAGDRVAYASTNQGSYGGYAGMRLLRAAEAIRLPDHVDDTTAAALMLKGLTAEALLTRCYRVVPGTRVLIHAAAGGVGLIVCQWARQLGATVIGTVGSPEKAELALAAGAHHAVNYNEERFVDRVMEITDGSGVDVVYDSVGRDTFLGSIEVLAMFGRVVSFGQSSGAPDPLDIGKLSGKSAGVSRANIFGFVADRPRLVEMSGVLFDAVRSGAVRADRFTTFPLADAAGAQRAMEQRTTTGSVVLIP